MNKLTSDKEFSKLVETSDLLLCFFTGKNFWGSEDLLCKVNSMLSNFPMVKSINIDIDEAPSLCAEISVFIAPTIIIFAKGKETIRKSKFIVIKELDEIINRYYSLLFG